LDSVIPPKELPALYLLPSLPVRHQGLRKTCTAFTGALIAEYHFPSIDQLSPKFIYYYQVTPCRMYGRNVFQILQKKEYQLRTSSAMGLMIIQVMRSISRPKGGGCQASPGFSRIHSIDGVKHALIENGLVFIVLPLYKSGPTFWRSDNDLVHDFHAVSIEGYDSNGFFFRNSWGPDWGNNDCGYLPFIDWSRVVEAWVGVSRRASVDSCQFSESHWRKSVYGNARRTSCRICSTLDQRD